MKIIGVIPARYASSRFPGKPLADIKGKPMIWWVYQQAKKVNAFSEIYVATDDTRIASVVNGFGGEAIMTSDKHLTGTDRIAEVALKTEGDLYINVQGDEPLIEPDVIESAIIPLVKNNSVSITNLAVPITESADLTNPNTVKVAISNKGEILFLSRAPIPRPKGANIPIYFRHIGVYGFKRDVLVLFSDLSPGSLEAIEEIEMLRFLEAGYRIKAEIVKTNSIAVDTPEDIKLVLSEMEDKRW